MSIRYWAALFLAVAMELQAQPRIAERGLLNAASYLTPGLPDSGIAQGSMFVVFGEGLGPEQLVKAARLPLTTDLAGTSIRIRSSGSDYLAYLLYTSAGQIAAVLPSMVPEGPADVTLTYNGRTSASVRIDVRKAAFGLFTQNQAGSGPAILQNYISPTTAPRLNTIIQAAQPGQVVILWGTGLGAIRGSDADRPPAGDLPVDVEVYVGGQTAKVLYKGRSPEFPGLDQINFEVPEGPMGCYVPLAVRAGGVMSNFGSLAIGASTVCGDMVSFRGSALAAAAGHGYMRLGRVVLQHSEFSAPDGPPIFWFEEGLAEVCEINRQDFPMINRTIDFGVIPGACTVAMNVWKSADQADEIYPELPLPHREMEAGPQLTVTGPSGAKTLGRRLPGHYQAQLGGMADPGGTAAPRFLGRGEYTVENANAAPDVGTFRATVPISGEITWTNKSALTEVNRGRDLTFEWAGGIDGREYVIVGGTSADETLKTRVTFICAEQPSKRSLTVPARLVGMLPKSSPFRQDEFPFGLLFVGTNSGLASSSGELGALDMLYLRYQFLYGTVVDFK